MTDPRVTKTRAALASAVLALATEKPFADVTVTEIAERAGVGYASFFRHYRDKDALLVAVADALVDDLTAIIMPALADQDTSAASIAICRFVDDNRLIARALLAGGAESEVRRRIVARSIERSGERAGERSAAQAARETAGVPRDLVVTHCVAATLGLLSWWLEQGEGVSPDAMGAVVDRLVMAPVRAMEGG
jgi:AcrR family transcriptional regulator